MLRTLARSMTKLAFQPRFVKQMPFAMVNKVVYKFSAASNEEPPNSNPNQPKQLKTIPLANYTAELDEYESRLPQMEFCLFSSVQPIFPYNPMTCQIKIGNLKKITKPMLYTMISPDNGEIFTVGIVLARGVEKNLNQELKENEQKDSTGNLLLGDRLNSTFNIDIVTKPKNYRVRIIKVNMTPEGIFATGIPLKDRPLTYAELNYNVENELKTVYHLIQQIKLCASYDRIDVFQELNQEQTKLSPQEIDELVYKIAVSLSKLQTNNLRVSTSVFVQSLLESDTYIERLLILRKQLEMMSSVMEMVNRHFKDADQQLMRLHQQSLAKLAVEYIKHNYLKDSGSSVGGSTLGGSAGEPKKQTTGTKRYYDKLYLIEDEPSREKIRKEIDRFGSMDKQSTEFAKINAYLDEVFSIPFQKFTPVKWDFENAQSILDGEIEGLTKVKERIQELIAVNKLKNSDAKSKGFILMLNGPPGTGKTSIAKAIAKSLQRSYRFISCAGVSDPTFFKGHKRTYVDAMPGVFVRELIKANSLNPVFILDEIDKVSRHHAGGADPYFTLLEILNPDENHAFNDHYLDIPVDFSHVIFILTSNEQLNMLEPLRNRLEIIDIPPYIQEEKLAIANNFLLKKSMESNGVNTSLIRYDDPTLIKIIKGWCYQESGVRELKRCLEKISRKYAIALLQQNPQLIQEPETKNEEILQENIAKLTPTLKQSVQSVQNYDISKLQILDLTQDKSLEILQQYLGPPNFDVALEARSDKLFSPGQANILTVGGNIGHVLTVECCFDESEQEKKGTVTYSGNIKTVLQESLKIAKINAFKYLNNEQKLMLKDANIHIHFMEGGTPKDGPSAGTAITTALISLATGFKVPSNLAMTGEISLLGKVCKIGGIQSKLIAAKTLQITDVLIPYGNMGETIDLPRQLLQGMNLYFVQDYAQIHKLIFEQHIQKAKESPRFSLEDVHVCRDGIIQRPHQSYSTSRGSSDSISVPE